MTEPMSHRDRAKALMVEAEKLSCVGINSPQEGVVISIMMSSITAQANTHATLAHAEAQDTANLIAYYAMSHGNLAVKAQIERALGIIHD